MNNPAHSIAVLNCSGNANRPELSRIEPYHAVEKRHMNQCFVLFAGSEQSVYNNVQSRLADIIYDSQTELQKQVVMSDRAE